jgi:signal transduction histidine kinase
MRGRDSVERAALVIGRRNGQDAGAADAGWLARRDWIGLLEQRVSVEGDDREARRRKVLFTASAVAMLPATLFWPGLYIAYGEYGAAAIPLSYAIFTAADFLILLRLRRFELFRNVQQFLILVLPLGLQLVLGGFVGSSAVILWAFIAVLSALLFGSPRVAGWWFVAYASEVVAAAALQPDLEVDNNLPHGLVTALFALNITAVSLISFAVLHVFLTDRRKLRALEVAFLNQELALRQSERMATLGTLAAGVAHELNNPAAATRRASEQLRDAIDRFERAHVGADVPPLTLEGRELLQSLERPAREAAAGPGELDALERSDRETAVGEWLNEHGVADAWELAPSLVDQGLDLPALSMLADALEPEALAAVLVRAASAFPVYRLVHEIGEASGRVSEIVAALKSYSFLGQAPVQAVDLHEGLDSTLVILRAKLKDGVDVHREYSTELPPVPVYGSDLNQVWTNLLDNAIDAMNGKGTITIRTRRDGDWAVVEIEDDGPGIPEAVRARIFDPFFTTKEPGSGTGLGLSTSYSVVTEKHRGSIAVESQPGLTRFTVRLPLKVASVAAPNTLPADEPV